MRSIKELWRTFCMILKVKNMLEILLMDNKKTVLSNYKTRQQTINPRDRLTSMKTLQWAPIKAVQLTHCSNIWTQILFKALLNACKILKWLTSDRYIYMLAFIVLVKLININCEYSHTNLYIFEIRMIDF